MSSEKYDRHTSVRLRPDRCPTDVRHPLVPLLDAPGGGTDGGLWWCNGCQELYQRHGAGVTNASSRPVRALAREVLRLRAQLGL